MRIGGLGPFDELASGRESTIMLSPRLETVLVLERNVDLIEQNASASASR